MRESAKLGMLLLLQTLVLIGVLIVSIRQDHKFQKQITQLENELTLKSQDIIEYKKLIREQDSIKFSTMEMVGE